MPSRQQPPEKRVGAVSFTVGITAGKFAGWFGRPAAVEMKLLVFLFLFFLTVDSCWSSYNCERANWWDSFQRAGWSRCPFNKYIVGFYRSANSGGKDYISRLEEAKCCTAPRLSHYCWSTCRKIYFWSTFDRNGSQVKCPEGYFFRELYRTSGNYLSNIEEARCCQPGGLPSEASCKWKSIGTSFDSAGLSECDYGYYMAGFQRGNCNELYCLEKLWCCKMHGNY
ncbi:hypothetical protein ACROYT_G031992 [Oculina patagonica]